jgi:hypothetical protein
VVVLFVRDLGFEPEATNVGNDLEAQMKNLLRIVALFVVVVLVASGCSYSEEAENRVRNARLESRPIPAHLSDACERDGYDRPVSFGCFTVSEQERIKGLLNAVWMLTRWDETVSYVDPWKDRTKLLKLLMDFEALEVLCYTPVFDFMAEGPYWPVLATFPLALLDQLDEIRNSEDDLSRIGWHWLSGSKYAEAPLLESVRFRHLCPSWMYE